MSMAASAPVVHNCSYLELKCTRDVSPVAASLDGEPGRARRYSSSSGSTLASERDYEEARVVSNDDGSDCEGDDASLPSALSTSARRRQRRQRQKVAIRAAAAEALRTTEKATKVYDTSRRESRSHITLEDLGFELCSDSAPQVQDVSSLSPIYADFTRVKTPVAQFPNRGLDAARPCALSTQQSWSPPCSPSVAAADCMSTHQVGTCLKEASERTPPSTFDYSNLTSSHAYMAPAHQRAVLALMAPFRVMLGSSILHTAPSEIMMSQTLPQFRASLVSGAPPQITVPSTPSNVGLGVSPHSILASIMSPDADALRSWLDAGGLPTSPCSGYAAVQLQAARPEVYED